jgi:cobalt-zinc-cadmium efflux system membrane fusion protein
MALVLLALPAASPDGVVHLSADQQKTIKLATAAAEMRRITEPVHMPGAVGCDEAHLAVLRPLSQGRLVRLFARPGDRVRAGQILAELDVPSLTDAEDRLAAAKATFFGAQAGIGVARDALRRGEILARDGALSRAEAERRRLELDRARADADAASAQLASLQAEIARLSPGKVRGVSDLISPMGGVVAGVTAHLGEVVDAGSEIVSVADLSVVEVIAQVPEAEAAMVSAGDPVRLTQSAGGIRAWSGTVAALGAALDPQSRTLPLRIEIANADTTLRAGMFMDVTLTSDRGRDGLVIPVSAVQLIKDTHIAFTRQQDGSFLRHDLQLGVQRADWVEVRKGLNPGDQVVTGGSFSLKAQLQQDMLGGAG